MAEPKEPLTERELEVLKLLATGVSNKEIAAQLFLSPNTIKVHLRNIFTKLEVQTRTEATLLAMRNGWVSTGHTGNLASAAQSNAAISDAWKPEDIPPFAEATSHVSIPKIVEQARSETQNIEASVSTSSDDTEATQRIVPLPVITPVPVAPNPQLLPSLSMRRRLALILAGVCTLLLLVLVLWPQQTDATTPEESPFVGGGPIFVPASDSTRWVERSSMRTARAGGVGVAISNTVVIVGGQTATGLSDEVLQYTLKPDSWVNLDTPKPTSVLYAGGAAIDNRIYVLGGVGTNGQPSRQFEMLNMQTKQWTALSNLPTALSGHAVVATGGKLYVFGGRENGEITNHASVFDPVSESWAELPSMTTARTQAAAAFLNDRIFVIGGYDGQQELGVCESYLIKENKWESCAAMTTARSSFGLAAVGQVLYAVGGGFKDFVGFNEKYDYGQKTWSNFEMPNTRIGDWRNIAVVALPTEFYVVGGSTRGVISADNFVFEVFTVQIALPALQK